MNPQKILIALITLILWHTFSVNVLAETILEKIERTGEINVGARKDAIPFGYVDEKKVWTGYSIDLINLIHQKLEQRFKKKIKLTLKEATLDNRFQLVQKETVDLVCEATTITQQRLEKVDFSVPFFRTGSQFLVKRKDAYTFDYNGTLAKIPIAFIPGTTTQEIIPQIYPFANWTIVKSRQEGIEKLKKGEVQAVVSDGILLVGEIVRQGNNPKDFALTPSQPITTELYGCMLPKNNPTWKELIDTVIVSSENRKLQQKWFNLKTSNFPYIIPNEL
ncbi:amino acid ABC transporter substrate-binding protein [Aphanothece sacrum]|uniref:Extracellular solute-binding protein family 1 n=1 Tax=Aphanothece sacrum FPU1 TaxID=1920663 RepID=A0A401ICU2_APHSA|nr:amino acid ABC transporter substrate-binding protein [Aphanothece sacrum]GBF79113.1 extracellular solute-binding protein family 1 [Aphanothece sacrum FPU1]GBF85160.1 extracellular solute-binding protein family 3 [Aphanothece sacrum FPU3]